MKQNITIEQFNECPKPRKFTIWMDKKGYGLLPTIGQMIEFLIEHEVTGFTDRYLDFDYEDEYGKHELCDFLWIKIKENL